MSESQKVLQFCHSYGTPFADVARQYAVLFSSTPYEVVTVFLTGPEDKEVAEQVGGEVIFLKNTSKDVRGMKRKQIKALKMLCVKYHFVFAIAHRFKPVYIASYIKNLPVIGVHHAYGDYVRWSRRRHAYKCRNKLYLLGVSNAVRDDMRRSLPRFPAEHICTLYNRVNVKAMLSGLLSREESRKMLHLPANRFIFGNVGRLHPDKDQSTLIKAFARVHKQLSDSRLVIIGTGRLEQALSDETETLGIKEKVLFLGKVPDAARYYRAFDSFVLSSDHEPFGMVLLEAMIAGVPVIASDCGGAPEVVGDTGQLFCLHNVRQLAECMQSSYHATVRQRRQQAEAMMARICQQFSDEAIFQQFWSLPFIKNITGT